MNAQSRTPIPLRPDPGALRDAAVASLVRAAISTGLGALDRARPAEIARARFGDDRGVDLVLRAAVSPTTIASAPQLAQIAVAFLATLTPMSAGADLLQRGVSLSFAGAASITVPAITMPGATFVREGGPIPVVAGTTSPGPTLVPHKIAVITTMTREMMDSANAEVLIRQALIESTGPALDSVLFGTAAASADAPAGLLNGIAALTPTAAGLSKGELLVDDVQTLAAAIAPVAGNGSICLVASPDAAVALALRLPQSVEWSVLVSSSLPARTVIAVASNAIASAVDGPPAIDASTQASFVRDTVPQEIVTAGGTIGTSVGSLFQSDQVALRLRWPISWVLRSSTGLAWMTGVNW